MMDNQKVAAELVWMARQLIAQFKASTTTRERQAGESLMDLALDQRELSKLEDHVDEQTWDLAVKVYMKLKKDFELKGGQKEAFNRLMMSADKPRSRSPEMHRNNIFKAAHALGISLPSNFF
jgi:hypothetical protein